MANGKIQIGLDVLEIQEPLTTSQKAVVNANAYTNDEKTKVAKIDGIETNVAKKLNIEDSVSKISEEVVYVHHSGKDWFEYVEAKTKLIIFEVEAILTKTAGQPTTIAFKDAFPVKDRIGKGGESFTLTFGKDETIEYSKPDDVNKKIEIVGTNLQQFTFKYLDDTHFQVSTDATLKVDGVEATSKTVILAFADYMQDGKMNIKNVLGVDENIVSETILASIDFQAHTDFAFDASIRAVDALKKSSEEIYQKKTLEFKPTITGQAGYIILDETQFTPLRNGKVISIDLDGLATLGNPPADSDRLFIGIAGAVTIKDNVYLKFNAQTNPTDTTIKPNFQTHNLVVEKLSDTDYRVRSWVDKATGAGTGAFVDDESWKTSKQDKLTPAQQAVLTGEIFTAALKTKLEGLSATDKASVLSMLGITEAELAKVKTIDQVFTQAEKTKLASAITAHQDISGLATKAELGTKQNALTVSQQAVLDGEVFTTVLLNKLNNLSNEDKASILNKLGLTEAQLNGLLNPTTVIDNEAVFSGHGEGFEYIIPNGSRIYGSLTFGNKAKDNDINPPKETKIDLTKKSQWEHIDTVRDAGYGDGTQYALEAYHEADGGISKLRLGLNGHTNQYFNFVAGKVSITANAISPLAHTILGLFDIDESRLLNSTGDSHIKNSGGYHSETSFGGGAFLGWANASYSEMAGFKNLNGIANFRYRDRGGTMSDVPINTLKYGTLHTDSTANKAVIRKGTFWRSETDTSINTPYIGIFGDNNYQGKMYWDGANMALNWRDNTTTDKTIKLKDIAKNDLTGVNVGTANAGKIFQVKTDGTIEFLDTHTVTATLEDDSTLSFKVIQ